MKISRDTECACLIANDKLVKEESLINEYSLLKMGHKNVYKVQKAIIEIELPYYVGKTKSLCFDTEYDLVIYLGKNAIAHKINKPRKHA